MNQKTRGPKPETVKVKDDWRKAIKRALEKKRPKSGWPTQDKPVRKNPSK